MLLSRSLVVLTITAAGLAACGSGDEVASAAERSEAQARAIAPRDPRAAQEPQQLEHQGFAAQLPRAESPGLALARRALEAGDAAAANRALIGMGDDLDSELLRARLSALEGDGIDAVRRIERARAHWPDQAEVFASAAEIHAQAGRLQSAEDEIRAGLAACGPAPAISRARAVLALARPGGARVALNLLLDARAVDPELPFLGPPLYSAHLLLGRAAQNESLPLDAIGHARAALLLVPGDTEARTLLGDAQAAGGQIDEALATFEELLSDGAPVRDTLALLYQRGGTAALVEGRRSVAVERHLRARALGLPASDLGFGATLLSEESDAALERGVGAFESGDLSTAATGFERALALDPDSLSAQNHLGVVRFQQGRFEDAARLWSALIESAARQQIELPEPVELNLARALTLDERPSQAREVLESWLERAPEGPAAERARELLRELEVR